MPVHKPRESDWNKLFVHYSSIVNRHYSLSGQNVNRHYSLSDQLIPQITVTNMFTLVKQLHLARIQTELRRTTGNFRHMWNVSNSKHTHKHKTLTSCSAFTARDGNGTPSSFKPTSLNFMLKTSLPTSEDGRYVTQRALGTTLSKFAQLCKITVQLTGNCLLCNYKEGGILLVTSNLHWNWRFMFSGMWWFLVWCVPMFWRYAVCRYVEMTRPTNPTTQHHIQEHLSAETTLRKPQGKEGTFLSLLICTANW
jgi:hypothetical protein